MFKSKQFQQYTAEMVGTFALTLAVTLSIAQDWFIPTPIVAALVLMLFVYTLGPVSGAHFNPAVTVGLATVKKIKSQDAVMYLVFQVLGALLAMLLAQAVTGGALELPVVDTFEVGLAEVFGAFFLVFGVSSVVYGRVPREASGLVIGGSLLLGILMTGGYSNAVLNPAVAIGLGSISLMYLVAPVVGGVLAAWLSRYLSA